MLTATEITDYKHENALMIIVIIAFNCFVFAFFVVTQVIFDQSLILRLDVTFLLKCPFQADPSSRSEGNLLTC